ncbi:LysR family transcriptional regulator [Haematobacter massiliensis]|uniref:LysR family transcriptional regulator n=1 Tax=Haematobacter massiliensis TaxID=195105 RepID=A0A086Y4X7_9RHOB|nr:LysR family transcriptional regulator [Haematobacter massiliensis]KFI29327.1 LysR family transcriptional regulator [Haematobacter massiliensis]OWJ69862.1 LysR family transcriptional regulator [Haematobacter massiliensis]OWJ83690.1 LysR family transcriptional regulator [Haematobacter massiliensis]QBJ25944.1 LysR family transcriptional regulator [Haematobacter massiliensis]
MVTLRQLEALLWVVQLGTFERAAMRLNTTQSAISKRIQELELSTGLAIFDRSQRGARLTEQGERLLDLAREMLALQDGIMALKAGGGQAVRRLRLGVTDLTALTWLPRLVTLLRQVHPLVTIEPEVDMSRSLYERLMEGSVDLIVIPEVMSDPDVAVVRLTEVANVWMARPGLIPPGRTLTLAELAEHPILTQGGRSGSGLFFNKWLKTEGIVLQKTLTSDSLTAVVGLTVAGLGVAYLPRQCFRPLVEEGKLVVVPVTPELPPVPYVAMYRQDLPSAFVSSVAELARDVCDFSRQLQA